MFQSVFLIIVVVLVWPFIKYRNVLIKGLFFYKGDSMGVMSQLWEDLNEKEKKLANEGAFSEENYQKIAEERFVKFNFNFTEIQFILDCVKKERRKVKDSPFPGVDALIDKIMRGRKRMFDSGNTQDFHILTKGFQEMNLTGHGEDSKTKKAREEYERIFWEKYGDRK
tara:strand:- start:4461 stop:4964 length:504 start_codon:yes stop_codon:yes gene_type:complete